MVKHLERHYAERIGWLRADGASPLIGAGRVTFWGAIAMGATAAIGAAFGTVTG